MFAVMVVKNGIADKGSDKLCIIGYSCKFIGFFCTDYIHTVCNQFQKQFSCSSHIDKVWNYIFLNVILNAVKAAIVIKAQYFLWYRAFSGTPSAVGNIFLKILFFK